ncbi:MAG TPA: saccharopine dehydrogenase NADP-binding domain-containing protein [Quisquiliibacterium sp.]|nr:saccharopine dehydrogenase NADP-binding domain-containing protein [Quisquiliibacterium sp.]
MKANADLDLIVYGATGYTGRLVAEVLARQYGPGSGVRWGMAGRNAARLSEVRAAIGAPPDTPLVVADADVPEQLAAMVDRTRAVITTVGPYQLYGDRLIEACAARGTDYLDLSGEPTWMAQTIAAHDATARASGARLVHSCGFDSIPFELGVHFCQETARARLGTHVSRVKGRVRAVRGGLSGGTAASGMATRSAIQKNPALMAVLTDPFALTPGFKGPPQPPAGAPMHDPDLGADVVPFLMAAINTKNIHRSNFLMGHPWGTDFQYDEMSVVVPGTPTDFTALLAGAPKPGEGPSEAERASGSYDLLFIGIAADGRQVRVSVRGDLDPGYGSTAKMLAEAAVCLVKESPDVPGGVWTPGAAMRGRLIARLQANAGLSFTVES